MTWGLNGRRWKARKRERSDHGDHEGSGCHPPLLNDPANKDAHCVHLIVAGQALNLIREAFR
jgi:hypothetical protein